MSQKVPSTQQPAEMMAAPDEPPTSTTVEDTPSSVVDETPISPIQRRDSLEKHLQQRPDPQELKDKHILLDSNAAP